MTSTAGSIVVFCLGTVVSLSASAVLIVRLERLAARLGFSQALLGLVAALAADAPEISSAVAALQHGQRQVGIGVVLGSNVFNLAALLGLGALVAGRIGLHRRAVIFVGVVGLWISAVSVVVLAGVIDVGVGLVCSLIVLVPYVVVSAVSRETLSNINLGPRVRNWLMAALAEEESELAPAIHPDRGGRRDLIVGLASLVTVVVASIAMERSASSLGAHFGVSSIVIGGIVLAAVTSLPNAVAAVYLAARGMGAAVLSEAMNSNTINVVLGFLVPGVILGLSHRTGNGLLVASWYAGLTAASLVAAYLWRGINRLTGVLIILAYGGFVVALFMR